MTTRLFQEGEFFDIQIDVDTDRPFITLIHDSPFAIVLEGLFNPG